MTILSDRQIAELCYGEKPMISPFKQQQRRHDENGRRVISSGISSHGYDIIPSDIIKLFTNINSATVDPKRLDESCLIDATIRTDDYGDRYVILPPNSYILAHSREVFNIPLTVLGLTCTKTTYARAGVVIPVTLLQSGWSGQLVLEVANNSGLPVKIYIDEGIVSILFFGNLDACDIGYQGAYQNQTGVRLPSV